MSAEFNELQNHRKFIPVLRIGDWKEAAPNSLRPKSYIDLSDEPYSERNYNDLIRTMFDTRESAPPIGAPPSKTESVSARQVQKNLRNSKVSTQPPNVFDDFSKEVSEFVESMKGEAPSSSDVWMLDEIFCWWVRPVLDGCDACCEQQGSNLFSQYMPQTFARVAPLGGVRGAALGRRDWERTKHQYLITPGFRLSDDRPVVLGAEYRFIAYTGLEDGVGFDLSLSVAWTLSKQNVEWGVSIDDMRMPGSGGRISYSECKGKEHDSSRFVRTVCGTLMDEIRRRSQLPSKASGFTRSNE